MITTMDELVQAAANKEPVLELAPDNWTIQDFNVDWDLQYILLNGPGSFTHTNCQYKGVLVEDRTITCDMGQVVIYLGGREP